MATTATPTLSPALPVPRGALSAQWCQQQFNAQTADQWQEPSTTSPSRPASQSAHLASSEIQEEPSPPVRAAQEIVLPAEGHRLHVSPVPLELLGTAKTFAIRIALTDPTTPGLISASCVQVNV